MPQVALAKISVRRDGRLLALDPAKKQIALHWNDRVLTVTAHALSFVDPKRNHYRFRLSGFDPDWVDTDERDTREFSALPAGEYRLQASAASGDGPWSTPSAPLTISVEPPPWATPWAWTLYALAALLLLFLLAQGLRRRLEQRHRYALNAQRRQLAEQANVAKTRFLATMAHEIRTPMTGVLGMAELLLGTTLDARQRGFAGSIRRSGALLLRQVNDALDLARIEAGKFELVEAAFDPAALLREVAAIEAGLAAQKGLKLEAEITPDAPRALRGDALRVQQVLLNLCHNALKFTERGGIALRLARQPSGGVTFEVSDSGPGLSEQEIARLFQRYAQGEHGDRHAGSGLGLAISRELVALMGGRIDLDSQSGRGSTFRVHLPLAECAAPDGAARESVMRSDEPGRGAKDARAPQALRILLVEDDAVAMQVITGLLEMQCHAVTPAAQALAALAELDQAQPDRAAAERITDCFDAILLDLELPGMDGYALARLLRARDVRIPIIAITAGATGDEEQFARDAGMQGFLRKPILAQQLRDELDEALR